MSEVYVTEPATSGKVVLNTSAGPVDVELFSNECRLTCINFIQLCLDKYYDNCIFHRVIKDFIVQTGDPTGTGRGGESIYGDEGLAEEFHSRLKFRYRGLVGLANQGRGTRTNGSQFFITLGRCDALNNRNTLFGKVTGNSLYNLLQIAELETDKEDRPLVPPVIYTTDVLFNPFAHIVSRIIPESEEVDELEDNKKLNFRETLATRRQNLLSFEHNVEDDLQPPSLRVKGGKSAHDMLNDPRLLKDSNAYESDVQIREENADDYSDRQNRAEMKNTVSSSSVKEKLMQLKTASSAATISSAPKHQNNKKKVLPGLSAKTATSLPSQCTQEDKQEGTPLKDYVSTVVADRKRRRAEEIDSLKRDIALSLKKQEPAAEDNKQEINTEILSEYERRRQTFLAKKRNMSAKIRQAEIFAKFKSFEGRLRSFTTVKNNDTLKDIDEEDETDTSWLRGGGLRFAVDSAKAYDIDASKDSLEVYDPLKGKPFKRKRQQ